MFGLNGKMSPREPSGASKNQKAAFSKTLKTLCFFKVFGYRGLSREPQEAQEGSQKAPKEIQDPKKKESKIGPKNYEILDQFWSPF